MVSGSTDRNHLEKPVRSFLAAERRAPSAAREGFNSRKSGSNSNSTLWRLGPTSLKSRAPTLSRNGIGSGGCKAGPTSTPEPKLSSCVFETEPTTRTCRCLSHSAARCWQGCTFSYCSAAASALRVPRYQRSPRHVAEGCVRKGPERRTSRTFVALLLRTVFPECYSPRSCLLFR